MSDGPSDVRPKPTSCPSSVGRHWGEESSLALLSRAQDGDRSALEALFARYLLPLRQWATGRLPRWARDMSDTQDLVQDALLATFKRIDLFEPEHDEALRAYLHQAVLNRIREEFRRRRRHGAHAPLDSAHPTEAPSPLEQAISREFLDRYEAALDRLTREEREAVVSRVEVGLSYDELAEALGKPTANAARMTVVRALVRLSAELGDGR